MNVGREKPIITPGMRLTMLVGAAAAAFGAVVGMSDWVGQHWFDHDLFPGEIDSPTRFSYLPSSATDLLIVDEFTLRQWSATVGLLSLVSGMIAPKGKVRDALFLGAALSGFAFSADHLAHLIYPDARYATLAQLVGWSGALLMSEVSIMKNTKKLLR